MAEFLIVVTIKAFPVFFDGITGRFRIITGIDDISLLRDNMNSHLKVQKHG